jgi:signal transduction histidine kinase
LKKQPSKKNTLADDAAAAAAIEERKRISRELHDRVLQLLSSVRLRAEMCRRELINRPDLLAKELDKIEVTADQAVAEIRRLLLDTRAASDLVAGSLERRLREEMEIFRTRSGMKLEFSCAVGALSLPVEVERELYFALREGLINAIRHSRASEVSLTLSQEASTCRALLADNGSGFDLAAIGGDSHYGLRILRERIERIGGTLVIQTAVGQGTRIFIEIPVHAKKA